LVSAGRLLAFEHAEEMREGRHSGIIGPFAFVWFAKQRRNVHGAVWHPERAAKKDAKPELPGRSQTFAEVAGAACSALSAQVSIEDRNGRGKVIIEYAKLEDFDSPAGATAASRRSWLRHCDERGHCLDAVPQVLEAQILIGGVLIVVVIGNRDGDGVRVWRRAPSPQANRCRHGGNQNHIAARALDGLNHIGGNGQVHWRA